MVYHTSQGCCGLKEFWSLPAILFLSSPGQDTPYIMDGLLYYETDVQTVEHYSDTWCFAVM